MQQPASNRLITPQERLNARRLAESNATTNHFLGVARRPWMTNAVSLPTSSSERELLRPRPIISTGGTSIVPGSAASEGIEMNAGPTAQGQFPAGLKSTQNEAARKRSTNDAELEVDTRWRNTFSHPQQPALVSPLPSSNVRSSITGLPDCSQSAANRANIITTTTYRCLGDFEAKAVKLEGIDMSRLALLQEACLRNDIFYLLMHQIFCIASIDPQRIAILGFDEEQHNGLDMLALILLANQDVSAEALAVFASVPAHHGLELKEDVVYRVVIEEIGVFLRRFAGGWNLLRGQCFSRKSPPFVMELVDKLQVHSPVLRKTLFNSIHRQLGGRDHSDSSRRVLGLFDSDQYQYEVRKAMGQYAPVRSPSNLEEQYQHITLAGHVITSAPSSSVSPLPPPQMLAPTEAIMRRRASASMSSTSSPQQCRGQTHSFQFQNSLSRSHSTNNLRIYTQTLDGTTSSPRSATFRSTLPSSMVPPSSPMQHSSGDLAQHSMTSFAAQAGQRPCAPQRRRGRPPLTNERGDHSTRSSGGSTVARGERTGSQSSAEAASTNTIMFFPVLGEVPIQTTNPNPSYVALHQAYLRSPTVEKIGKVDNSVADVRLYQYLREFAIQPRIVDIRSTFIQWQFGVSPPEFSRKVVDTTLPDGQVKRPVSDGRLLYRFRSVEVDPSIHTMEQEAWSIKEMSWPPSCFVRINDVDVELRRKIQHGKDLPIDLTPHIREGKNDITVALLRGTNENAIKRYLMAVEVVEIADQARINAAPTIVPADASLRSITQALTSSGDEEVQVIDSHISIDLIDPFMATIFDVPARGRGCTHRECFDLQTFFQTRKSRVKGGPTSPDEWRCPICKLDARPVSLVVDCFLKTVRDSLVDSGGITDARAILVGADGSWEVKREARGDAARTREHSSATVAESPATGATMTGKAGKSMSAVIEIEDD